MADEVKYLIVGAGPTGLAAASRMRDLGIEDFLVLEQANHAGGLAASFTDEKGFTWDIGGHVLFSHYPEFDALMAAALPDAMWLPHRREAWALMEGRWIPYPIQSNIRRLSPETLKRCFDGLVEASHRPAGGPPPPHFEAWLEARYGRGLAETFLWPYNRKVWAWPLDTMSSGWVGDRVAPVDVDAIARSIREARDDIDWGPNRMFRFPRRGGTGAIWRSLADRIGARQFRLGCEVTGVDTARREVETAAGGRVRYRHLLSTLPLDRLCRMVRPALDPVALEAVQGLGWSASNIVGLGLRGQPPEALRAMCWMYFPEANCPFYRVTVFSNYSPENVPTGGGHWSLIAETSESVHKPVAGEGLVEETIRGCLATGLIASRNDVETVWRYRAEYGYPVPTLGRDAALGRLLPALESRGVQSRGRFGAWRYEVANQDHSAMQGIEWADRLEKGIPERTYGG